MQEKRLGPGQGTCGRRRVDGAAKDFTARKERQERYPFRERSQRCRRRLGWGGAAIPALPDGYFSMSLALPH